MAKYWPNFTFLGKRQWRRPVISLRPVLLDDWDLFESALACVPDTNTRNPSVTLHHVDPVNHHCYDWSWSGDALAPSGDLTLCFRQVFFLQMVICSGVVGPAFLRILGNCDLFPKSGTAIIVMVFCVGTLVTQWRLIFCMRAFKMARN